MASETNETREKSLNFLEEIIEESIAKGETRVQTRFPPEPNGYLHIGHAKSICINFGLAKKYGGKCNLRFDDTNPVKEDVEYVDSIKRDIQWLGFDWAVERYASDYFDQLYDWAIVLIKKGLAYVDDQTQEQIRENRGTVSVPGTPSPWRDRSVEENLDLFVRMKNGEFPDGAKVLRAKIDMAHPNMLFRYPIMYRIIHAEHHRTGNKWCIYPMYDYAHGHSSDSIEQITHSICTLEFDVHRPLYDWFIQALEIYPSHQYEFARLNLTYTMMSKRKLLKLVQEGAVMGWDDPRMPTICALRRKGYTPASVRNFAEMVGVAKRDNVIDLGKLEYCVREDLNKIAERRMAVLNPLKVVITNYEEGKTELFTAINNPEDESAGTRQVPFSKVIYIERDDFMEGPPKKFFRLAPGGEVRLRYSYLIRCEEVIKDAAGNITELRCTYDPMSGRGSSSDGRRVKGVIHWVSAKDAVEAEIRLFNPLFTKENPRRREGRTDLGGQPQPRIHGQGHGLPGAVAARHTHRAGRAVRARRLLLPRHRLDTRTPRVQPHGDAQGFVGENQQVGKHGILFIKTRPPGRTGRSCFRLFHRKADLRPELFRRVTSSARRSFAPKGNAGVRNRGKPSRRPFPCTAAESPSACTTGCRASGGNRARRGIRHGNYRPVPVPDTTMPPSGRARGVRWPRRHAVREKHTCRASPGYCDGCRTPWSGNRSSASRRRGGRPYSRARPARGNPRAACASRGRSPPCGRRNRRRSPLMRGTRRHGSKKPLR